MSGIKEWKLVPVEPTEEMLSAVVKLTFPLLREECLKMARDEYIAMLAAAPLLTVEDFDSSPDGVKIEVFEIVCRERDRLQKEAKGWEYNANSAQYIATGYRAKIDVLKAEIDRHISVADQHHRNWVKACEERDTLQSELTKAREFIRDAWGNLPARLRTPEGKKLASIQPALAAKTTE